MKQRTLVAVYAGELAGDGSSVLSARRLTLSDSWDHAYDWTPDSRSVLFDSNRDGTWDVFKQTLDQRMAEKLVAGGVRPAMAPDGESILYFTQPTTFSPQSARIMGMALAGGPPRELGYVRNAGVIRCARTANLCVVSESDKKGMALYALDPAKGKGRELLRIDKSLLPKHGSSWNFLLTQDWDWDVSPDGSSIALATRSTKTGTIQIHSLASGAARELSLSGWTHPMNIRWSADGRGWFLIALPAKEKAAEDAGLPSLLRLDLAGKIKVLRQECSWLDPIPSPDGRHLALGGRSTTRDAWMLENF